ncbi:MAG TPA: sulfotransferase family 2 domain-containing protein [Verrucomicrobiae bacterium]
MSEIDRLRQNGYSLTGHYLRRWRVQVFRRERFRGLQEQRTRENAAGFCFRGFDDLKCIFVHIPKCAGVAVCKSLFGNLGGGHKPLKQYQIVYTPAEFISYFKFTFVRNPWDRLVSAFWFLKKGGMNEDNRRWAAENLSPYEDFDSFVRRGLKRSEILSYLHFRPQCHFVCLKGNQPALDFVGRYEKLESDFAFICRRLNIESKLVEANRNASRERDYREYYTEDTRRIVGEIYADDAQAFAYSFDPQ